MRQTILAAKHDRYALVQWKQTQGVHQIVAQTRIDCLRIVFALQLLFVNADEFLTFARVLTKTVVSDPVKPGGETRLSPKAAQVFIGAQKRLLREIIGQTNVAASELAKETAHSRLMISNQLCECVMIVIKKGPSNKLRIC